MEINHDKFTSMALPLSVVQNVVLTIGYTITGFAILAVLMKKRFNRQTWYGVLLLFIWCLRYLTYFFKKNLNLEEYSFLIVFDQNLLFLDGILLYWYIKSLGSKLSLRIQLIQLIPVYISFIISFRTYFSMDALELFHLYESKKAARKAGEHQFSLERSLYVIMRIGYNLFFILSSFKLMTKYENLLQLNYSNIKNLNINWLRTITWLWLLLLLVPLMLIFINYLYPFYSTSFFEILLFLGMLITTIVFSVNVINQKYILERDEDNIITQGKVEFNQHDDFEMSNIFDMLNKLIEEKELYKKESLSLKMLSESAKLKPIEVSRAINLKNGTYFHEYINSFRIAAVKKELLETNEQIIIIAYRNGFNSKSTFNAAFKKNTGMTPSEYRKTSGLSQF